MKREKGSVILIALVALSVFIVSMVRIGYAIQAEKVVMIQGVTSVKVKQLLIGLNEHYIAECYAGAGVYTQPANAQEIIASGYLPSGNYRNTIGGDFDVSVNKVGDVAVMRVEAVFDDEQDAIAIASHQMPAISIEYFPVDNRVRWEMINQLVSGVADIRELQYQKKLGGILTC